MRIKKAIMIIVLTLALLATIVTPSYADTVSGTSIMVNNQIVLISSSQQYVNGTLLSTAKELLNSLGGTFSYDDVSMTGTVRQGENELLFRLDNSVVKFNGKYIQAPAPLKIINNRFMLPVQFIAEKLGAEVYTKASKNVLMIFQPSDGKIVYDVMSGDSLWIISQMFGTSINSIKQLNNITTDTIYVGQRLIIKDYTPSNNVLPAQIIKNATIKSGAGFNFDVVNYIQANNQVSIVGKDGDWFKVITPKGNGYVYYTTISVTQEMNDNAPNSLFFSSKIPVDTSSNYITYSQYTVQRGDNLWLIAEKFGIPVNELIMSNGLSTSSVIYIGQTLSIPVHNIPVKSTVGVQYGEVLDWFDEGQYVFSIGKTGRLTDLATGKSFMVQRTMGASHSDTETVTVQDTQIMKEIFGGTWSWNRRPFILEIDGRRFAVSISGMPHAGVDGLPYLQNVSNRSDNWGYGPNYDRISGNGMDGHFDVYFLNCLRHMDNKIDPLHQFGVMTAGGLQ